MNRSRLIDLSLGPAIRHRQIGLVGMFEEQVGRRGEAPAVSGGGSKLSYGDLDRLSAFVARELEARGVKDNDRVAVCLPRSPEMVAAVLGAVRAGAAYVPLDPAYPRERLAYMLENAEPSVVITNESLAEALPLEGRQVLLLGANAQAALGDFRGAPRLLDESRERLGYIIYTSGSTGKPKGVALGRGALTNLIHWQHGDSRAGEGTRTLQFSPLSFDVSFQEIFATLCSGGELVLITEELRLDAPSLVRFLEAERVERLYLPFVALQALAEAALGIGVFPSALREVITAGEQLQATDSLRAFFRRMPEARLWNHYGPSETHVITSYALPANPDEWTALPSIGKPLPNTSTWILSDAMEPVAPGETGMLYLGGVALADGYFGREDLTRERFVPSPFGEDRGTRLYKTGDLARFLPDGNIEFLGRADDQVKVRGFRIELGEVELAIAGHPAVRQCAVAAREDVPGDKRLVAYVVGDLAAEHAARELRAFLESRLPDYMVPSAFVVLGDLPRTPSGKIDRRALPAPAPERPAMAQEFVAPRPGLEANLARIWADVLRVGQVGAADGFFDLGGNSLLVLRVLGRVRSELGMEVSPVKLFEHPTVRALAAFMEGGATADVVRETKARMDARRGARTTQGSEPVAIVGMAVRLPGADTLEAFWTNLITGTESIHRFTDAELDPGIPKAVRDDPRYVKARGIISGPDTFDAKFFGINPREAEALDPQQRVFLELAWTALEHAGYAPDHIRMPVGVYAGTGNNTYYGMQVLPNHKLIDAIGEFNAMVANEKDYVATRVAHKLNLKGPALSIVTACSTSLVAIAEAAEALRLGHADMAVAGAASVACPPMGGYLNQSGGMLSGDGHCRPFDAKADGTVFSDGAGAVVLRRLSDALRDGDHVWAVIRGVGLNNDGAEKMSFTAPSVDGQAGAIAQAHLDADVDPATISYVETHGTATPLGDPIEVEALHKAFGEGGGPRSTILGSVKSNFGHVTPAAGVAGLVKTVLAMEHRTVPPMVNFESPNPSIPFERTPFHVNNGPVPWTPPAGVPMRAGVSSFGVGGTNAHVVVEEAPATEARGAAAGARAWELVVLSAKSESALDAQRRNLSEFFGGAPVDLTDVTFTLAEGRSHFEHRSYAVVRNADEARAALGADASKSRAGKKRSQEPEFVFVFPGQGAQYAGMGKTLYDTEPRFRAVIDRVAAVIDPMLGLDLRAVIFGGDDMDAVNKLLAETRLTQPAIFAIEVALAEWLQSVGIRPTALVGHSIGEYAAAVVAGVFSLEDAARLVATRGRLMQSMEPGAMLSVRGPRAAVESLLGPGLAFSAFNGPELSVVGGREGDIAALERRLEENGIVAQRLRTSHAFHTPLMEPMVREFEAEVARVERGAPGVRICSTADGAWLDGARATDPTYWSTQVLRPVRFSDAIHAVWGEAPGRVLVEVGPRAQFQALLKQHMTDRAKQVAFASMPAKPEAEDETAALLKCVGEAWLLGAPVDFRALRGDAARRRVPLPTYPFERKRFWSTPEPRADSPSPSVQLAVVDPAVSAPAPAPAPAAAEPPPARELAPEQPSPAPAPLERTPAMTQTRKDHLVPMLRTMLEDASGLELADAGEDTTFIEMGLDSLLMTQLALNLSKKFAVKLTFRELLDEYPTLSALSGHLDARLPAGAFAPAATPVAAAPAPVAAVQIAPATTQSAPAAVSAHAPERAPEPAVLNAPMVPMIPLPAGVSAAATPAPAFTGAYAGGYSAPAAGMNPAFTQLFAHQLSVMQQQLAMMGISGGPPTQTVAGSLTAPTTAAAVPAPTPAAQNVARPAASAAPANAPVAASAPGEAPKKAFGAGARIERSNTKTLNPSQRAWLDRFIADYTKKSGKSKAYTQANRSRLADPRAVSGFTPLLKEITYPIVVDRSAGSRLWDIDGNEYIDITVGFGTNYLGHHPKFIDDAIKAQMDRGYEIGPQHPLTAEVGALFCELTGNERVAFANTGSEAVLGALRLARTVTGNDTVVMFNGAYHGIFDEVIVRGTKSLKSMPAAPGIPAGSVENTLILDYDDPASLEVIRQRAAAGELAAVLVETVQSRRPGLQPKAFLEELRRITESCGAALIFDEVITGFRIAPGGSQEHFGIRADLATYGKIIGGGMPIGVIGGKARFMDALDGGQWRYGDDSFPEVGVTYYAGTFVRHPLTLAAAKATLTYLKEQGPGLQRRVNAMTDKFIARINAEWDRRGCELHAENFGSLFKVKGTDDLPFGTLVYHALRQRGVHIWDARPCFITAAHTEADVDTLVRAFTEAVDDLQAVGLLPGNRLPTAQATSAGAAANPHGAYTANGSWAPKTSPGTHAAQSPPRPDAKLGRDPDGTPAWYAPDPDRPGKYIRIATAN
jgi:amino acid adenylation domain-containing protein